MTPIVIVVRDPDASNDYTVFDGEAETYDIDCGRMDLHNRDEFLEWAVNHIAGAQAIETERPQAAESIRSTVLSYAESGYLDPDIQNADCDGLLALYNTG